METRNTYAYPIDERDIVRMLTTESESHRVFKEKTGSFDLSKAVDFLCKEGTPIKAAFEGKIVKIKNSVGSKDILPLEKQDDNHVIIRHLHDEFSIYSHLTFSGAKISGGQIVNSDDLVGYSGRPDYDGLSCVHFMVYRFLAPPPSRDLESLEIRWKRV